MGFIDMLLGSDSGGLTHNMLKKTTRRQSFSDYLPWVAYNPTRKIYYNTDETIGFLFECAPMSFAGEDNFKTLETGLFRMGLPDGSVLQFILYADPYIDMYLDSYRGTKIRENKLTKTAMERMAEYYISGKDGLKSMSGIPLRNFRLLVSVKMPLNVKKEINYEDIYSTLYENLKGANLYPQNMEPSDLLALYRRLFNGDREDVWSPENPKQWYDAIVTNDMNKANETNFKKNFEIYNNNIPIRKQVIASETVIEKKLNHIKIGDKYFRCMTVKTPSPEVYSLQTNELFGGIWGLASDMNQIGTPFMYCLNIIFYDNRMLLHKKANFIMWQKGFGSMKTILEEKQSEFRDATHELEKGTPYVQIIPIMWVWDNSLERASETLSRAKRLWESQGYYMQEDKGIVPILFVSSLPFGMYASQKMLDMLDRDLLAPSATIAEILPIQSDFSGGGQPLLLFAGRKGQIVTLDIFDKHANNNNIFVTSSSGAGKSFFINYLVCNYFAAGALIRIVDIGASYKKMTNMFGARFIDFTPSSDICLNPFTNIRQTNTEDTQGDLQAIVSIVMQMAFSATDIIPEEFAELSYTICKYAVRWVWSNYNVSGDIDKVIYYLQRFPGVDSEFPIESQGMDRATIIARELSINLSDFSSNGVFGRWFNGPCNFNISKDEFVVLELETLKTQKELFKVVTLQIINAVTQDLYLSDRKQKRMVIFDEAWQFLGAASKGGTHLQDVIEEGYRRARKYGGSFSIVTQSLLDLKQFGPVGDVIRANSAFKFYLESPDFEKALKDNLLEQDDFGMRILKTVKSNPPKYSEIFMETPFGIGVARLLVDPYSYYMYTSSAKEISEIEDMVKGGMTYDDAVAFMVKKYRA